VRGCVSECDGVRGCEGMRVVSGSCSSSDSSVGRHRVCVRPTSSSLHCPLPALCVGPLSYIARVVQASQAGHIGQGLHVSTETVATQIPAESTHGIGFCGPSTCIRLTQPLQHNRIRHARATRWACYARVGVCMCGV
jgi:hypothetical protein